MKPVKNRFHLDFPLSLQEEFMGVEGLFESLLAQSFEML